MTHVLVKVVGFVLSPNEVKKKAKKGCFLPIWAFFEGKLLVSLNFNSLGFIVWGYFKTIVWHYFHPNMVTLRAIMEENWTILQKAFSINSCSTFGSILQAMVKAKGYKFQNLISASLPLD